MYMYLANQSVYKQIAGYQTGMWVIVRMMKVVMGKTNRNNWEPFNNIVHVCVSTRVLQVCKTKHVHVARPDVSRRRHVYIHTQA